MNAFDADLAARCQRALDNAAANRARFRLDEAARRVPAPKPRAALDAAIAEIDATVAQSIAFADEPYVSRMVRTPHLITSAVYGPTEPRVWPPVHGAGVDHVLEDCRMKRLMRDVAGHHHHPADRARIDDLRRAEAALLRMLATEAE